MAQKINVVFILKILIVIAFKETFHCVNANKSKVNTTLDVSSIFSATDHNLGLSSVKKWQVGRVSRKHYEIVNMVWRKTKIFINPEPTVSIEMRYRRNSFQTTNSYEHIKPLTYTTPRPATVQSTPSYIEFYYLDDNDERVKRRDAFIPKLENSQRRKNFADNNIFLQSPVLSFHINDRHHNPIAKGTIPTDKPKVPENILHRKPQLYEKPSLYGYLSSRFKIGYGPMSRPSSQANTNSNRTTAIFYFGNETCPSTTSNPEINNETVISHSVNTITTYSTTETIEKHNFEQTDDETTVYDKIKFFEMYDDHTIKPINNFEDMILENLENLVKENEIVNRKSELEEVHRNIGHYDDKKANVKKHIAQNVTPPTVNLIENKTEKKLKFKTVMFNINKTAAELRHNPRNIFKNSSRVALWSDYPFAAVYIYEPSQIHCDAAALSQHWLVAAGSCLSRFHKRDPETEGRSAFVAYCGQSWWQPERVTYVKYSIVHPRFNPKDNARKYLYNIGLIQVAGSMSTCFGWAPVTLMSHHFATNSDGSKGTAVGWGLDRYDVRYTPMVLPKEPLSAYDSYVYSETCPGSTAMGKQFLGEETTVNMYCLSLPPYFGEKSDPVHGSLLLVGGNLIALYLQEERRIWGEQSAQYTGVWRLVPWVHEVAKEPDEVDTFAIDF